MRLRTRAFIGFGVALVLALTGCQPGDRGQTGLMVNRDGVVFGLAHLCHGSATGFDLWAADNGFHVAGWGFDEPVEAAGSVELGTLEEIGHLIGATKEVYFSAGTHGVAGGTTPLKRADIDLDQLEPGEVLYVTWDDDKREYVVETAADFDAFSELSCDGY